MKRAIQQLFGLITLFIGLGLLGWGIYDTYILGKPAPRPSIFGIPPLAPLAIICGFFWVIGKNPFRR